MVSRKNSTQLLALVEEGMLDKDRLITDLIGWLSEDEVREFCNANDIQLDEEDEEYDGQPDEAQEWHDYDPDC